MSEETQFRVVIAGANHMDFETMCKYCDAILSKKERVTIVTGATDRVITAGQKYAKRGGLEIIGVLADWVKYKTRALYVRNDQMLDVADAVIAFYDGESPVIRDLIEKSKERNIKLRIHETEKKYHIPHRSVETTNDQVARFDAKRFRG